MKSITKSLKFITTFFLFGIYFILLVTTALFAIFAPFGAGMLLSGWGYHPSVCFFAGFLIVLGYVVAAEKLGHLDDLYL
jgi:hypothetical protein